jgi:hypothetical protein
MLLLLLLLLLLLQQLDFTKTRQTVAAKEQR